MGAEEPHKNSSPCSPPTIGVGVEVGVNVGVAVGVKVGVEVGVLVLGAGVPPQLPLNAATLPTQFALLTALELVAATLVVALTMRYSSIIVVDELTISLFDVHPPSPEVDAAVPQVLTPVTIMSEQGSVPVRPEVAAPELPLLVLVGGE